MSDQPKFIIVGGPNGAGKSTAAAKLLPAGMPYVNADEVAKGLPNYPSQAADLEAGRIVLERMDELAACREDFAVETTLAGISLSSRAARLRKTGYLFRLIYLWTPNPEFSILRVRARVRSGGHHIPEDVIRRRHAAGMVNFFSRYRPIADSWEVYDSTEPDPVQVAEGMMDQVPSILKPETWARIRRGGNDAT